MQPPFSRSHRIVIAIVYVAGYLLLEWLCYARPALAPAITPWHPQAGLTLAFLVMCGPSWSAFTAVAAMLGASIVRDTGLSAVALACASAWIALVSAAASAVLRRLLGDRGIRSTADAARFAAIAAGASFVAAAGPVGAGLAISAIASADAVRGFARYSLGELNGILMVAPLLLAGDPRAALARAWRERPLELVLQFALVLAILALIFALPDDEQLRFLYLLFVPVIWIALRWDWKGALPAVLVIQSALIFAAESALHTPRFIDTQILMLTLTLTALLLGSVVAERRRSELRLRERDAELARAMRFAVAGELASATAHELNQPMTALVSYLNAAEILARTPGDDDERLRATVRKAAAQALRAADVLHRLRNFYIGGGSRRERIDVAVLIQNVVATFGDRLQRSRVTLRVIMDEPRVLEADETQLHIVLHNLVANAIDAAENDDVNGRVEIELRGDCGHMTIAVEDSGGGIDASIAERLFEPFTTTKSDGMGLGLAISRSLVRSGGGELTATHGATLGGARLVITLPAVPA